MERYSGVLPAVEDAEVEAAVAGIDAAVLAAQQDRDRLTDAWRRTFSLPYWYFLAQTEEDGQHGLYLGTVQGRPHIAGFTTARRLRTFAIHDLGVCSEQHEVPAAVMTPQELLGLAGEYAERGVEGIAFDHGINGHYTPLTNLEPLWRHCFDGGPTGR